MPPRITSLRIQGYRPFRDFSARLAALEVLVGANGSGKSSLFEFLRFLRDSLRQDIPPEIVAGSAGQQIFHKPGPESFRWAVEIDLGREAPIRYLGEVSGPVGRTRVAFERVEAAVEGDAFRFLEVLERRGVVAEPGSAGLRQDIALSRSNQLALSTATNPALATLYALREAIEGWRFYSSFQFSTERLRRPVAIEERPVLREDAGNLSSLLHFLLTEHREAFDELQEHLHGLVPGFLGLSVKARGGPGQVMAFWREKGPDEDLSLADLSDGTLRLLGWAALSVHPAPPSLIVIDEPDQGVHPRTLPLLAGLFEKAAERTQVLVATHSSYFLLQFDLDRLAVLRREGGEAVFLKPKDSKVLCANLEDFGTEEIERMHRSDELERLS